jgi:hypothetical protein
MVIAGLVCHCGGAASLSQDEPRKGNQAGFAWPVIFGYIIGSLPG